MVMRWIRWWPISCARYQLRSRPPDTPTPQADPLLSTASLRVYHLFARFVAPHLLRSTFSLILARSDGRREAASPPPSPSA